MLCFATPNRFTLLEQVKTYLVLLEIAPILVPQRMQLDIIVRDCYEKAEENGIIGFLQAIFVPHDSLQRAEATENLNNDAVEG